VLDALAGFGGGEEKRKRKGTDNTKTNTGGFILDRNLGAPHLLVLARKEGKAWGQTTGGGGLSAFDSSEDSLRPTSTCPHP
jgi:hypothetical protein